MKINPLNTGNFKLDGGAMFGVVPKSIWNKTNPADENNLCNWAMRSLLIEENNRLILIDTGIGDKQDPKFLSHYHITDNAPLEKKLNALGYTSNDISDVILTHLHFDHCGGAVQKTKDNSLLEPTFKNATYWSNEKHWKWATEPNKREKASFLSENILPIEESGQLKHIKRISNSEAHFLNNIDLLFMDGHTESMMLPKIQYKNKTIVFMADLLPSVGHIPLPYIMGYDTRPLLTLDEKENFLIEACNNEYILFFQHDFINECCTLQQTDRGIRVKDVFKLKELV
jgi:glyoxylase-like metal-dependent hydrolase (beta-lactamase superfamily II)